ncbi:ADP-ribosylglycohydrolase family protein, partial [Nocardioides sp.]
MTSEPNTHLDRVTRSMLWAAWADALGFITERTTPQYVEKRVGAPKVTATVEWTRRVGGKFGVEMVLPAGTYSDDTQLRLASSRAISGSGFDPEAFAKVDLAVWPSYALGGGRASKAAAANIARSTVPWFGNFYDGYLAAGGNGAAMRIQPHVWAAPNPTADTRFLVDVLRDAVITHGHPRALVGAVLHAIALSKPMSSGKPLTVEDWPDIIGKTRSAAALVESDENLSTVWLPLWEKSASKSFPDSWSDAVEECALMLDALRDGVSELQREVRPQTYDQMVTTLDLRNPDNVGSGTATGVIALAVATAIPDPGAASRLVANALG